MIQGAEHLQKEESQGPKGPGKGDAMPPPDLQGAEFQIGECAGVIQGAEQPIFR